LNNCKLGACSENSSLVQLSRKHLQVDGAENLYAELSAELNNKFGKLSLNDLLGSDAQHFENTVSMPGMFTIKNWTQVVLPRIKQVVAEHARNEWIMGQPVSSIALINHFQQAYHQAWYQWMFHLKLKPFSSLQLTPQHWQMIFKKSGSMEHVFLLIRANEINNPAVTGFLISKDGLTTQYLTAMRDLQNDLEKLTVSSDSKEAVNRYVAQMFSEQAPSLQLFKSRLISEDILSHIQDTQAKNSFRAFLEEPIRVVCCASAILRAATYQA